MNKDLLRKEMFHIFITMELTLKAVNKLLDNFILPKHEDIMEYEIKPRFDDNIIEIIFWMDGSEQEIEESIVEDTKNILEYLGSSAYKFIYRFTTGGENFYSYE